MVTKTPTRRPPVTLRPMDNPVSTKEERFRGIFDDCYSKVVDYACRRVPAHEVDDVVSATFLVVWRRLDDVPTNDGTLPWTYGVARRVVADHRRTRGRWQNLLRRINGMQPTPNPTTVEIPDADVAEAMGRMRLADRTVLALAYWEDLNPAEIGQVLGVSTNAATIRLHRARKRFAAGMAGADPDWQPDPRNGAAS